MKDSLNNKKSDWKYILYNITYKNRLIVLLHLKITREQYTGNIDTRQA